MNEVDPGLRSASNYLRADGSFDWDKYNADVAEWNRKNKQEVELRPELREFAEAMELRLRENDHKSGWDEMTISQCHYRFHQEAHELDKAIFGWEGLESILHESEDAANFLFFLWWNARRELA